MKVLVTVIALCLALASSASYAAEKDATKSDAAKADAAKADAAKTDAREAGGDAGLQADQSSEHR